MPQHPNFRKRHSVCLSGRISWSPSPHPLSCSLVVLSNRATMMTFPPNGRTLGGGRRDQQAKYSFSDIKPVTINSLEKKNVVFRAWTGHTDGRMNKAAKTGGSRKAKIWFGTKPRFLGQAAGCNHSLYTPLSPFFSSLRLISQGRMGSDM